MVVFSYVFGDIMGKRLIAGIMPLVIFGSMLGGMDWDSFNRDSSTPGMDIVVPREGYLYINGREIFSIKLATIIIGPITVMVDAVSEASIERVEFYMNGEMRHTDHYPSYSWICDENLFSRATIGAKAYDYEQDSQEKEMHVWIFNGQSMPDSPPQPCIVEPSNSWVLFDPAWKTVIVDEKNIVVQAAELNQAEDIVSTVFEYSVDKINWIEIGRDDYPGFEGIFLSGEGGMVGETGWSAIWNLSSLHEGFYYIRAEMTDEGGQTGYGMKKIYYDPSPPLPEITSPSFEEAISGTVEFRAITDAEDIVSAKIMLFHEPFSSMHSIQGGGAWCNVSTGNLSTSDLPADSPWRDGPCCPIAATNALSGFFDDRLYPNGISNNLAMADMLAGKMKTTGKGTNAFEKIKDTPAYDIYQPDNLGGAINDYLAELGINCSNPTGYTVKVYGIKINSSGGALHPVPGSSTANFETYSRAIREGQAVILVWIKWEPGADKKWGTPDDTVGESHAIAGRGCSNKGTERGQATDHPVSYTDVDGKDHTMGWRDYNGTMGNFSVLQGANTWNLMIGAMYVICPKNATVIPLDEGIYNPANQAWAFTWNTLDVEDGFYTVVVEMEDSNGFVGRDSIIVEVDNIPEDNTPPVVEITSPENNTIVYIPEINITGYASDNDSGIVNISYLWEWESGSSSINKNYDPPENYVPFTIEIQQLKEGWNRITANARDAEGNEATDSITIYYEQEEDVTPPITNEIVGMPNWEDGYVVANYTIIWLNATDDISGVRYIYYEVWWDSNGNGIIDMDERVLNDTAYGDSVSIQFGKWNLTELVRLCWFAVDNAGNAEVIHCREHYVAA